MQRYHFMVLTNAVKGRDAEFNDWYTNRHLADVLKLPGVTAAQRFALSDSQRAAAPYPWQYLAIYEVETNNIQETIEALKARSGTPEMPLSDAMDQSRMAYFYEPITERVTA